MKLSSIISWLPGGNTFKIHQPKEFIKKILENHFRAHTGFKSFTRHQVSMKTRIIVFLAHVLVLVHGTSTATFAHKNDLSCSNTALYMADSSWPGCSPIHNYFVTTNYPACMTDEYMSLQGLSRLRYVVASLSETSRCHILRIVD